MSRPAAPAARREVVAAVRWLARQNPEAARGLRLALVDTATLLGSRPLAGRRQPELVGERYWLWPLAGFPYVLVYDPQTDPVQILRIVHTSQDLPNLLRGLV